MKTSPAVRFTAAFLAAAFLAAALLAAPLARAGDAKAALVQQVNDDNAFYLSLQFDPSTIVPNWVVSHAKGVLIVERAAAGAANQGVGLLKVTGKKFSAPAFFVINGASGGLQNVPAGAHIVAFLMTDQAVHALTGGQNAWNGLHVAAGDPNATAAPAGALPDVILFQQNAPSTDPAALLAGATIAANNSGNALYYDQSNLTAADIFNGKVDVPSNAGLLVKSFNDQAASPN
jgi:lipid-binding SYLF domain-containing protein